jgi:hypothetical protein
MPPDRTAIDGLEKHFDSNPVGAKANESAHSHHADKRLHFQVLAEDHPTIIRTIVPEKRDGKCKPTHDGEQFQKLQKDKKTALALAFGHKTNVFCRRRCIEDFFKSKVLLKVFLDHIVSLLARA